MRNEFLRRTLSMLCLKKKTMLFKGKQALVVKAMYQTAFLARENGLNFGRWFISDFESTTLKIS